MRKIRAAKTKKAIAKQCRAKGELPALYIKINDGIRFSYARVSLRVKAGQYVYLQWRDGDQVKQFYCGKKRKV